MKVNKLIAAIAAVATFTSCQSLRTISSKDTSASQQAPRKNSKGNVKFIDNIEVTPGTAVTSRHKTINTSSTKKSTTNPNYQKTNNSNPNTATNNPAIENASFLQLKYAVMLDATVEKLNNIPLLQTIDNWWGTKYCMGGSTKSCIDCSAFTTIVMKDVYNIGLPRTAQEQYDASERISVSDLQEGDLVFFKSGKHVSHVGVYILNNKFVHAATSGGVMISDLNDKYWHGRYKGAGRYNSVSTPVSSR